ncbi:MAG: hypothetical protein ABI402_06195 [Ferruginibacter sp.]
MSLSLTEYQGKLISKIMCATSQEEVKRYIETAMKSLELYKLNGHIIHRFVDKIIYELELFSPINKNANQWSNIKMARVCFNKIKTKFEMMPGK